MTVETVTYITDLNATYPDGGDAKSEGDNHIRNIKTGLGNTFPNFTGIAMTSTEAELNILDGATVTTAELNILDGVTATATEINTLDASAQAVTGFTYSNVVYIDDVGDSQGGNTFDATAVGSGTWESIGPTGSGATNTWTALNALPSNTKWIEVRIYNLIGYATGISGQKVYGRINGSSVSPIAGNILSDTTAAAVGDTGIDCVCVKIPVSSKKFDLYRLQTNGVGATLTISLQGFGV